jgi:hypothetical protein
MTREKSQDQLEVLRRREPGEAPDPCRPALCALGDEPHAHCLCGLPMAAGATLCDLCRAEGLHRDLSVMPASRTEWDGVTFPSLRIHRPTDIPLDRYDALLGAILGPLPERNVLHFTTGEAA